MLDQFIRARRAIAGVIAVASLLGGSASAQVTGIPAGTEIVVRTGEAIDSRNVDLAKEYVAVLDEPLTVNGAELAPKGADAVLMIADARGAGAVRGRASLTLHVVAVVVNGNRVSVNTDVVTSESGSQAGTATKGAIGGAAVGALIGGLLGGGSGAAQGAAIGAGAGVGAAVLRGQRIQVPAETRLTFVVAAQAQQPSPPPR
jgi:hypothetical protein